MKMKLLIIAIFSTVLLSSCLKSDDPFGFNDDKGSIVIEIFDRSYYGDLKVIALEAAPPTETFDLIELRMYAPRSNKPSGDVQVTLELVPGLVAAHGLTELPAGSFTLPNLTVTIPKAGGIFTLPLTVNKALLDLSQVYGIAFKIVSVSEGIISDLSNEITVALIIKNEYHADYTVTGYFFHPSAPRAISGTKEISTVGAIRCQAQVGDLGGWNFQFDVAGTNLTNWGSANGSTPPAPPGSGFMSSDNPGAIDYSAAAPNNPGVAPWVHSTYNNTYDPATKTFWMHYGYNGTNDAGRNRQIYEKWVRQ